jgi:antiviral helicase SKI2
MHLAPNLGKKVKMYFILALVNADTKGGAQGVPGLLYSTVLSLDNIPDTGDEAVPPIWPPTPKTLVVDNILYEMRAIPLTSIIYVTKNTIKVILIPSS